MSKETGEEHAACRTVRVAAVQMESQAGDKPANFAKIQAFVEQAAGKGVKLIVFPECCITGYWFIRNLSPSALKDLAEPIFDGESSRRLVDLARNHGITIGAGLIYASHGNITGSRDQWAGDGPFRVCLALRHRHRDRRCLLSGRTSSRVRHRAR